MARVSFKSALLLPFPFIFFFILRFNLGLFGSFQAREQFRPALEIGLGRAIQVEIGLGRAIPVLFTL